MLQCVPLFGCLYNQIATEKSNEEHMQRRSAYNDLRCWLRRAVQVERYWYISI